MAEQVREHETVVDDDDSEYVETDVTIHGNYIGKVKVKKGATRQEVLEAVRKKAQERGIDLGALNEWNIFLNDERIEITKDGKVREDQNKAVNQNSILVLSKRIVGGPRPGEVYQLDFGCLSCGGGSCMMWIDWAEGNVSDEEFEQHESGLTID